MDSNWCTFTEYALTFLNFPAPGHLASGWSELAWALQSHGRGISVELLGSDWDWTSQVSPYVGGEHAFQSSIRLEWGNQSTRGEARSLMIGSLFLKDRRSSESHYYTSEYSMFDYTCDDLPSPGIDHRRMTQDSRYLLPHIQHCSQS